ncbi:YfhO family protein [Butyrivibrio fibrisolvens]|uniref:YfhO family protein n=1 Tax=Butyrivibrio fibrisolvens TaxID=831 RepID=UPI00041B6328|nr:YfhO family protein [Butyrivibrio fibrisolvens]
MSTQYKTSNQVEESKNNKNIKINIIPRQNNIPRHEVIAYYNRIIAGILAFSIPAVIFLMLCAVNHITPFGDRTFLYEDMKQQYMDFYAYYRAVLHGEDNFLYSAYSGLGSNMLGTWTYYLTSPFLIIFALVPERLFPVAVTFMTMLKIAAIGFTTWVFLRSIHSEDIKSRGVSCPSDQDAVLSTQDIITLICSTAFAFSGWVVANMTNSMWLDAVIVMPLFAAAYVKVLRYYGEKDNAYDSDNSKNDNSKNDNVKKDNSKNIKSIHAYNQRPIIYLLLSVMALLYANYYIGAMILLFAGIFTGILFVSKEIHIKEALRLLEGVVLGIVCDLWFLIPAFMSLVGSNKDHSGKSADALARFLPLSSAQEISLSPIKLIAKLFSGSYDSIEIMEGLPNIYFGTALIIIVIMFFFNPRISIKKRIIGAVSLLVMVLFFCDKHLNVIAHGGTQPYGYLYRYSFLFSFGCIILAYEELMNLWQRGDVKMLELRLKFLRFIKIRNIDLFHLICSLLVTTSMLLIAGKFGSRFMNSKIIVMNIGIVLATLVVIWFLNKAIKSIKLRKFALILLGFIITADLSFNFIKVYASSSMMARGAYEYQSKTSEIEAELKYIHDNGDDSYRIESIVPMTPNESLHFEYKGVTSYNSLLQIENRLLLYRMGFNDNGLYATYESGNTRCADAILGIKYIITDGSVKPGPGQRAFADNIIENEYVLRDNIITSSNVEELLTVIDDDDNPFEVQEKILQYLLSNSYDSHSQSDNTSSKTSVQTGIVTDKSLSQTANDNNKVFSYADIDNLSSSTESAEYIVTANASGELYFYMNRVNMEERTLQIYVNDAFFSMYGNASCQKVIDLGFYEQGEEVSIRIITDGNSVPADIVVVTEALGKLYE